MGIFLIGGIGRVSIRSLGYRVFGYLSSCGTSGDRVKYLLIGLRYFYLRVRCPVLFGV